MRVVLAGVVLLLFAAPSCAEDVAAAYSTDYDALVGAAPSPVVDPEVTPASAAYLAEAGRSCPSDGYCAQPCDNCLQARFTGWYASGEVTIHEPSFANSLFTFNGDSTVGGRLIVGHESSDGYGIRGRFWGAGNSELDTVGLAPPHNVVPMEFGLGLFEVDFYKRFWGGASSFTIGAGPRAGALEISPVGGDNNIGGGGVGAFVEFWHPVYLGPRVTIAVIGHGRGSILGGESELAGTPIDIDTTLTVAEAAFGIELRRQMGRGDFVAAFQVESMLWDANVFSDLVLDGLNLRFGYQW